MKEVATTEGTDSLSMPEDKMQTKYPHLTLGWLILFPTGLMLVGRFIILKYIESRLGIPAIQTYTVSMVLSLLLLITYSAATRGIHSLFSVFWSLFRPISILFMFSTGPAVVTLVLSYIMIGAGDACAIFVVSGPLGTFFSWFIYDDQGATVTEVVSLCLCILGVICIVRPPALFHLLFGDLIKTDDPEYVIPPPKGYEFLNGYVLALISCILIGIQGAIFPMFTKQNGKLPAMIVGDVGKTISIAVFLFVTQDFSDFELFKESIPWIVLLVMCNQAVNIGWTLASVMIPISHQAIILSCDKIWAYIFGIVLFHETPYWLSIVGAGEVWIAIIMMGFSHEEAESVSLKGTSSPQKTVEYSSCTTSESSGEKMDLL